MSSPQATKLSYDDLPPQQTNLSRASFASHTKDHGVRLRHEDYNVGWICALPLEMATATAMLDRIHENLPRNVHDSNMYTLGNIGPHNIAIACLPEGHYGSVNAATVGANMRRTFLHIGTSLMVGIGGGIPGPDDIRLGDIVVGDQVIQFDFGKALPQDRFYRTSLPIRPPQSLLTAIANLRADHEMVPSRVPSLMSDMLRRHPFMTKYTRPEHPDRLFHCSYNHDTAELDCNTCDERQLVDRIKRKSDDPFIHYGKIASGNQVVKDSVTRDKLAKELSVICVEMEAAGLTENFPCLTIRGICDYADSHKSKEWQRYAAAAAAAYAKELLLQIPEVSLAGQQPSVPSFSKEQRTRILESLDLDEEPRHLTIKTAHTETCEWFKTHESYRAWLDPDELPNHQGFLWLNGRPGVGKSTLMKFAYDHAVASKLERDTAVAAFFFNARGSDLGKSTTGMYRSLLLQIFNQFLDLQEILDEHFPRRNNANITFPLGLLKKIFSDVVRKLGHRTLICFIDALDECEELEVREMVQFAEELGARAFRDGTKFFTCLSCRHYPYISMGKCCRFTLEDQEEHDKDIEKYIRASFPARGKDAITKAHAEILRKSAGVFLWVVLAVNILRPMVDRGAIFKMQPTLQTLPPKPGDLFRDIINRDSDNMDELLLCIQWILFSRRPLSLQEYYFALAASLGTEPEVDLDPGYTSQDDMKRFVLSSSKGLAETTKSVDLAREPNVQFIHETVREFLIRDDAIFDLWPERPDDMASDFEAFSHAQLVHHCHVYIRKYARPVQELLKTLWRSLQAKAMTKGFPLLNYATKYILHHVDKANKATQQMFIEEFDFELWLDLYNTIHSLESYKYRTLTSVTNVLVDLDCSALLQMVPYHRSAFQLSSGLYRYPFFCALAKEDSTTARALLSQAYSHDVKALDKISYELGPSAVSSTTPLHWAAHFGHATLCTYLLDECFSVPNCTINGQTALHFSAAKGHDEVIKVLLSRNGINVNCEDEQGRTTLSNAASQGHVSSVKLLLSAPTIEASLESWAGQNALFLACLHGHVPTAELILELS